MIQDKLTVRYFKIVFDSIALQILTRGSLTHFDAFNKLNCREPHCLVFLRKEN
jgi:hypothetical protein